MSGIYPKEQICFAKIEINTKYWPCGRRGGLMVGELDFVPGLQSAFCTDRPPFSL